MIEFAKATLTQIIDTFKMAKSLGVVASSGGSVFAEMARIAMASSIKFVVIVDRPCGIETVAETHGINCIRIIEPTAGNLSRTIAAKCMDFDVSACLLFFSRLVGPELFDVLPTFNIHPAFLPFYPGLKALQRARADGQKFLGATLHRVDASLDEGPIVAQTIRLVDPNWPMERWKTISFLQKLYLSLVWAQQMLSPGDVYSNDQVAFKYQAGELNATSELNPDWLQEFRLVEAREGIRVIA